MKGKALDVWKSSDEMARLNVGKMVISWKGKKV